MTYGSLHLITFTQKQTYIFISFDEVTSKTCSHIDRLRLVQVSSIQVETALRSDWIDLEPIAIVSGNNHCSHCSSDSIQIRFNFLLSSGHVPSADCCLDIIMADLANRVLFMLICILNAMIVDLMKSRLLQRGIYRLFIQRMPSEHVLNRSRIDLVVLI